MTVFGVLADGMCIRKTYEAANTSNCEDFLRYVYKRTGPIFIIMDNASYHSKKMIERLRREGLKIEARFLPPYSPDLNPMETQWREDKRAVHGRTYPSVMALVKAVKDAVKSGVVKPVKMYGWLLPDAGSAQ